MPRETHFASTGRHFPSTCAYLPAIPVATAIISRAGWPTPTPPPPAPTPSPPPRTAAESPRSPALDHSVGLHNGSRPATHHPSQTWIRPPPTLAVFRVRMGGGFEHPNPAAGRPPSRNTTYFELSYPPSRAMPRYRLQLLKLFIWTILSRFIDLRSVRSGYIRATLGKGSPLFSMFLLNNYGSSHSCKTEDLDANEQGEDR